MGHVVLYGCMVATVLLGARSPAEIIDRILAVVDGDIVTLSDVNGAIQLRLIEPVPPDPIQFVLERLIERRLTLLEVDRYAPPEPSDAAIETAVSAVRTKIGTPERFDAALAQSGLTLEQLRRHVRNDLRIETYLRQRFGAVVQATEPEIIAYYREHQADFTESGTLRPFERARDEARTRLVAERRAALIRDWLAGLRRRAEVNVLYLPSR